MISEKTGIPLGDAGDQPSATWFQEFESAVIPDDLLEECHLDREELITKVKNLWELECLVRALDAMETLASLAEISREYVSLPVQQNSSRCVQY
jgi:nuclear pore complex protein Nup107